MRAPTAKRSYPNFRARGFSVVHINRRRCLGVILSLWLLFGALAGRLQALDLSDIAPNFQVFDEANEKEEDFYRFVGDHVVLLWFWDWRQGCPV